MRQYEITIQRNYGPDIVKIYAQQKREAEKFVRKIYRQRAVIVKAKDKKDEVSGTGRP
jgi:hypothetical protein